MPLRAGDGTTRDTETINSPQRRKGRRDLHRGPLLRRPGRQIGAAVGPGEIAHQPGVILMHVRSGLLTGGTAGSGGRGAHSQKDDPEPGGEDEVGDGEAGEIQAAGHGLGVVGLDDFEFQGYTKHGCAPPWVNRMSQYTYRTQGAPA
jgi:hypothetical protein